MRECVFCPHREPEWDAEALRQAAEGTNARWILWGHGEDFADMLPLFDDPRTFAVSRQRHFRGWKPMPVPMAPFRELQEGEASRVLAPVSDTILVDRARLLALGIPRASLAGTAWMLLFWKAAAAGWRSYSIGQKEPLREQPDFPMQELAFVLKVTADASLRRLGPRQAALSRGAVAHNARSARGLSRGGARPRVLVVSPFLPYPLSHGGAVRIWNLCAALADRVDFVLAAVRESHDRVDYGKLGEVFRAVYAVDIDERAAADTSLPEQVRHHQSAALRALIAEIAREWQPDVLQIEYTHMAHFRDAAPEVPALLVEHDLTYSLHRQLAESRHDRASRDEYQRWLAFERGWLERYDAVWTVSEEDRARAIEECGREPGRTFSIPNGVDIHRFAPEQGGRDSEIFYVGSFRHLPNLLGFEKLVREVMPRVWRSFPETRLRVVAGPRYEEFWKRQPLDPRIGLHGFLEDLRPMYRDAAVVAVPLVVSAGTNIKVLEAMACGKALVTTAVGCSGLGLRDGREALIRDDWDGFAAALCGLLDDPLWRAEMGADARAAAVERFSWRAIADDAYDSYCALNVATATVAGSV
jgi:glycosyltransferase involved in cell wall biosynthesis